MPTSPASDRQYVSSRYERFRLHARRNISKAAVSGVSVAGILAGFLSAAGVVWHLLAYLAVIAAVGAVTLVILSLPGGPAGYVMLGLRPGQRSLVRGRPRQLELVPSAVRRSGANFVLANKCDD